MPSGHVFVMRSKSTALAAEELYRPNYTFMNKFPKLYACQNFSTVPMEIILILAH